MRNHSFVYQLDTQNCERHILGTIAGSKRFVIDPPIGNQLLQASNESLAFPMDC